jgi:hypothetical protein
MKRKRQAGYLVSDDVPRELIDAARNMAVVDRLAEYPEDHIDNVVIPTTADIGSAIWQEQVKSGGVKVGKNRKARQARKAAR